MANPNPPPFVLLDGAVQFVEEGQEEEYTGGAAAGRWSRLVLLSPRELEELDVEVMKPLRLLAEPPQVSCLYMVMPAPAHMHLLGAPEISSTHKGIVVIYADDLRRDGCYLLYDASKNALSVIPSVPGADSFGFLPLGRSAVLVGGDGDDDDDYILADIVTSTTGIAPRLPEANIFAWSLKQNPENAEWVKSSITQLPLPEYLCGPTNFFHIDMAFSFAGHICWVDLLHGILLCDDLLAPQGPRLAFIPLPDGYCLNVHHKRRHHLMPLAHRSMGCVNGVIKFVALVGWDEISFSADEVMLKTWALSPDFNHWKVETMALSVQEIWASESFNQMGLPHVMPMSPLLSPTEDGVIYAILNVVEHVPVPRVDEFGEALGTCPVAKANYMIRFNIPQNKVLSTTKISEDGDSRCLMPFLLATDFSAYLQDHKRAEEAGKVGASAKRKRKQMEEY